MTHEEHEAIISLIMSNPQDQGVLSEQLNLLRTDYNEQLIIHNTNTTEIERLNVANEKLVNVNNSFMLQLGDLSNTMSTKDSIKKEDNKSEFEKERAAELEEFKDEKLVDESGRLK